MREAFFYTDFTTGGSRTQPPEETQHMKKYIAPLLIALLTVSVISATGIVSAKGPTTKTLATPDVTVVVPGAYKITFVSHATSYNYQIEAKDPDSGAWTLIGQGSVSDNPKFKSITIFDSAGSGTGKLLRVRAEALNTDTTGGWAGATSDWSAWQEFSY
ncbi:MAG: hypothetical protein ACXVI7_10050 [Halobacteriota archaeon]